MTPEQFKAAPLLVADKIALGELLWCAMHNRYVRFLRDAGSGFIVVADRNTMAELPYYTRIEYVRLAK